MQMSPLRGFNFFWLYFFYRYVTATRLFLYQSTYLFLTALLRYIGSNENPKLFQLRPSINSGYHSCGILFFIYHHYAASAFFGYIFSTDISPLRGFFYTNQYICFQLHSSGISVATRIRKYSSCVATVYR